MSLLIVRAPLKPLNGSTASSASDWQDLACAERFEWCLVEDGEFAEGAVVVTGTGTGTTDSMPYADQALVLMPTLDVRLIEAKVPLANAKKLQQILPNLVEEYLLGGAEALAVQAFPPVPGKPALQRTLALIDRAWYAWLTKQLEGLLCPRVRLIPDCLVLDLVASGDSSVAPSTSFMRDDGNVILSRRTGEQLGVGWIERENLEQGVQLPSSLGPDHAVEIAWDWLAPSAQAFIKVNASSKSANFALNLLPNSFRKQSGKSSLFNLAQISGMLGRQASAGAEGDASAMSWADPVLWRRPRQWLTITLATMILGFGLHLTWLAIDDWRWTKRMELLAAQSLTSASVADLTKSNPNPTASAVLGAFIEQVTREQRRQGAVTDADFASMAAKLQQLKASFGADVLQSIEYDGYGMNFEFKPGAVKQSSAQVLEQARMLGLMVKSLEVNRYRLEPYAGLSDAVGSGGGS
ncbi:type II secretion system protein GspL [Polynucleobacter sp. 39-46-10]|jgi:hypothetical protein|uniref:type II secretion system protein GspL n=1 Tax=Polynucleobacter sp. 39-46-10 TaxID=1970428 RepID=UPI000BD5F89F|nr:type II secretion system protein GspL [Polynucleobacter sp. 39-46-10]OZA77963.1 MAG: hypothetical protein B7X71_02915 [Polynucleobacter sp. 39-46-10]